MITSKQVISIKHLQGRVHNIRLQLIREKDAVGEPQCLLYIISDTDPAISGFVKYTNTLQGKSAFKNIMNLTDLVRFIKTHLLSANAYMLAYILNDEQKAAEEEGAEEEEPTAEEETPTEEPTAEETPVEEPPAEEASAEAPAGEAAVTAEAEEPPPAEAPAEEAAAAVPNMSAVELASNQEYRSEKTRLIVEKGSCFDLLCELITDKKL